MTRTRTLLVAVLALVSLALTARSALAQCDLEVTNAGGAVSVVSTTAGRVDAVTITREGNGLRVVDPTAMVCAVAVPWVTFAHGVEIPLSAITTSLEVRLTDGADTLVLAGDLDLGGADLVAGADGIVVTGDIVQTGAAGTTLEGRRSVQVATGGSVATVDGTIAIQANVQGLGAAPSTGVHLTAASLVTTGTGNIQIHGRGSGAAGAAGARGVHIQNAARVETTGTGEVGITGIAGLGDNDNKGIDIADAGTVVRSRTRVALSGTGAQGTTGTSNHGVSLVFGGPVVAGVGDAEVVITAVGGGGASNNLGLEIGDGGSRVSSEAGTIRIDARVQDGASTGLLVRDGGAIVAGDGAVDIVTRALAVTTPAGITAADGIAIRSPIDADAIGVGQGAGALVVATSTLANLAPGAPGLRIGDAMRTTGPVAASAVDVAWPIVLAGASVALDGVTAGAITATATTGRVTAAGAALDAGDGALRVSGVFAPGPASDDAPARVVVSGDLTLGGDATLRIDVAGTSPGTGYDQLAVTGAVALGASALDIAPTGAQPLGSRFVVIDNDGADAIVGTFAGVPEGARVGPEGATFTVSYQGGDGNDLELVRADAPVVDEDPVVEEDPVELAPEPATEAAPEPVTEDAPEPVSEPVAEEAPTGADADAGATSDAEAEGTVRRADDDGCAGAAGGDLLRAIAVALVWVCRRPTERAGPKSRRA